MISSTKITNQTSLLSYIRPFNPSTDMAKVADLIELCFQDTLDEDGKRYINQMREFARNSGLFPWAPPSFEWARSPFIGYVWEQDYQIVGNISMIPYRLKKTKRYLIANVAVHPDFRHQGIAHHLTRQAIAHARDNKVPDVWLHVRQENATAINLYKDLGFQEVARRTTWYSQGKSSPPEKPKNIQILQRSRAYWRAQKQWLIDNYPPELSWHLPLNIRSLQPGISGSIYRLINNLQIQQWAAVQGEKLLAVISWQHTMTYANILWLAAPIDVDQNALKTLLIYVRHHVSLHRPLMIDFPANIFQETFREVGFVEHQTLIWMNLTLRP